jgi:hypothetical protein
MLEYTKHIAARVLGAWMVLKGDAIPVPVFDEDTTVVVIETEGSKVNFISCRSFVDTGSSYNILLSKMILWMCSKGRFFWTSDQLGNRLKEVAEEYFEEHEEHKSTQ